MSKNENLTFNDLSFILEERGKRIRERFQQEIVRGIEDATILRLLNPIRNGKDSLRPALTSLSCEAVGGSIEASDSASLMFSLASMGISIHDDIVDKSKMKHLKSTFL